MLSIICYIPYQLYTIIRAINAISKAQIFNRLLIIIVVNNMLLIIIIITFMKKKLIFRVNAKG